MEGRRRAALFELATGPKARDALRVNILIVGLGYTGTCLAQLAVAAEHEVTGVRRQNQFPHGIRGVTLDVARAESLAALPSQPDAIAYLVGADSHTEAAYRSAYQSTLQKIVRHYAPRLRAGRTRLVFASSTAVYGASAADAWVDEETPALADSFSARILREAEDLVWEHQGVVLRLGGIYGPERTAFLLRVARGELTSANAAARYTNRIHQVDAARAMLHLAQLHEPQRLYLGVDQAPETQAAVVAWLEAELRRAGAPSIPAVKPESQAAAQVAARPGTGRVVADKRCSSQRLRAAGFEFKYPSFREGYAPLIADLARANGAK